MPSAAVPKTAIYKYGKFFASKYKIWFAGQILFAPPPRDMVLAQNVYQTQFGAFIARCPNFCHDFGTFLFGEHIRHVLDDTALQLISLLAP